MRGCHLNGGILWSALSDAARGLGYLHSVDILHLDVKPSNLLRDSGGVVRICDLSNGRHIGERFTGVSEDEEVGGTHQFDRALVVGRMRVD